MFESYWIILDLISVEKRIVPPLSGSGQSATLSRYWSSHLAPAHGSNHLKPKIPGPLMMILWSFIPKNHQKSGYHRFKSTGKSLSNYGMTFLCFGGPLFTKKLASLCEKAGGNAQPPAALARSKRCKVYLLRSQSAQSAFPSQNCTQNCHSQSKARILHERTFNSTWNRKKKHH